MRFTEHEMTVGVEAVGRRLFASIPRLARKVAGATEWEELTRMGRYRHIAAAGELVLPGLTALPERPTVGATPAFSDEEYAEAAEAGCRARMDQQEPGAWDALPERRRRKYVTPVVDLLRVAVAAMPARQDPDALIVPDHL